MKKALSIVLAFILAFGMLLSADASSDADTKLQFNDDGVMRLSSLINCVRISRALS